MKRIIDIIKKNHIWTIVIFLILYTIYKYTLAYTKFDFKVKSSNEPGVGQFEIIMSFIENLVTPFCLLLFFGTAFICIVAILMLPAAFSFKNKKWNQLSYFQKFKFIFFQSIFILAFIYFISENSQGIIKILIGMI